MAILRGAVPGGDISQETDKPVTLRFYLGEREMIGGMIKLQPDYWRQVEGISVVSTEECEAILHTARLPINRRNRAIFNYEILCTQDEIASRSAVPKEVDLAQSRDRLIRLSGELAKEMQTDAGRVVVSAMKIPVTLLLPMEKLCELDVDQYVEDTVRFHNIVELGQRLFGAIKVHKRNKGHDVELQDWLFDRLYKLFAELKDARPGNARPLYQFTIECAKLVGINITITEEAFRMRIQRMLRRWRKGIEILANVQ
jgi:hypothetical protein